MNPREPDNDDGVFGELNKGIEELEKPGIVDKVRRD